MRTIEYDRKKGAKGNAEGTNKRMIGFRSTKRPLRPATRKTGSSSVNVAREINRPLAAGGIAKRRNGIETQKIRNNYALNRSTVTDRTSFSTCSRGHVTAYSFLLYDCHDYSVTLYSTGRIRSVYE